MKGKKIMFVCSGNTCRSPMAEYLFREICQKSNIDIQIISRGTAVNKEDKQAQEDAIESVKRMHPNSAISNHNPTQLTLDDILNSDFIITMAQSHKDLVMKLALVNYLVAINGKKKEDEIKRGLQDIANYVQGKTFTLKEINGQQTDISDPYNEILNPVYRAYSFVVYKIKDEKLRKKVINWGAFLEKVKLIPNVGPFKPYRQEVYDNCRDEILGGLNLLAGRLKP